MLRGFGNPRISVSDIRNVHDESVSSFYVSWAGFPTLRDDSHALT